MSSLTLVVLLMYVMVPEFTQARDIKPGDIQLPSQFTIQKVADGLAGPLATAFDDKGRLLIAESGYGGSGESKVTRVEPDGNKTVLVRESNFDDGLPITAIGFYRQKLYLVHSATVSTIDPDGTITILINNLPGKGDYPANRIAFKDDSLYVGIGTVTNSGVVGPDNASDGWLNRPVNQALHDVPCQDITVSGETFSSPNVLGDQNSTVNTSAYAAFGTSVAGQIVMGNVKCNGTILKASLDGSNLAVVAWGLRNPFGLRFGPNGRLYATIQGFEARGSRPVANAPDCFYAVQEGAWYGWPDFACGTAVTDTQFEAKDGPPLAFVFESHPTEKPPLPLTKSSPHSKMNGFAFAPGNAWGDSSTVYLAEASDMAGTAGLIDTSQNTGVLRLDTLDGTVTPFITNTVSGLTSENSGGLAYPVDVNFGPDLAMYITDWGVALRSDKKIQLEPNSGVVWKVTSAQISSLPKPSSGSGLFSFGTPESAASTGSNTVKLATEAGWLLVTLVLARYRGRAYAARSATAALNGLAAGLMMLTIASAVVAPYFHLPWHMPARVFAVVVEGGNALANTTDLDMQAFLIGGVVLLFLSIIGGLVFGRLVITTQPVRIVLAGLGFSITVWTALQYFVLPYYFPIFSINGLPPLSFAVSMAAYGLLLGLLTRFSVRPTSRFGLE